MKKFLRMLFALGCFALMIGCKKESTTESPRFVISNLVYDPKMVTLRPNSTFVFLGTIDYVNASGGVAQLKLTTSSGANVTVPVPENSQSNGTLTGNIEVVMPTSPGTYSFELWIVDGKGNISNKLSGTVQALIDDGATIWRPVSHSWALHRVLWANNQYIAVGENGVIVTSPDGENWTPQNSGTSMTLYGVAWLGSQYVAVGQRQTILTSPDGANWIARNTDLAGSPLYGVAGSGNEIVAVGEKNILRSTNGTNWTQAYSLAANSPLNSVRWIGNKYIAVGGYPLILTSMDGTSWSKGTISGDTGGGQLGDVSFSGTIYAAVGYGITASSTDGINWNAQITNWGSNGVVWSGTKFVAAAISGIRTSTDGVNWIETSQAVYPLRGIGWSGMQYVAVGFISPVIMVSP